MGNRFALHGDLILAPGRSVYSHMDRGDCYKLRDRYHLVLRSSRGFWRKAGDEELRIAA